MQDNWLRFTSKVYVIAVALLLFIGLSSAWAERQSEIDAREATAAANVESAREGGVDYCAVGALQDSVEWSSHSF